MKPILFNTEMVRAILDGRKTQTRRVIKYGENHHIIGAVIYRGLETPRYGAELETHGIVVAPYQSGDILYVRETFCLNNFGWHYRADWPKGDDPYMSVDDRWSPSIHMPKEAARMFLRVTDVRAERLQDMTDDEIANEGVIPSIMLTGERINGKVLTVGLHVAWQELWDSTIKPADRDRYGWAANPWVWVICFERCEKPEEARDGV